MPWSGQGYAHLHGSAHWRPDVHVSFPEVFETTDGRWFQTRWGPRRRQSACPAMFGCRWDSPAGLEFAVNGQECQANIADCSDPFDVLRT